MFDKLDILISQPVITQSVHIAAIQSPLIVMPILQIMAIAYFCITNNTFWGWPE